MCTASCSIKAAETFVVDSRVLNRRETSSWRLNSSIYLLMYSMVASVWYRYYAISWEYREFNLMHNMLCVDEILWLTERVERDTTKTGSFTLRSAIISRWLHYITWLYALLNRAKPGYGGIMPQSWLNLLILECCLRKDITQSIKCLNIPSKTVWRISGMRMVVGDIHFIFQKTPFEVPTSQWSTYCPSSLFSALPTWVPSIVRWMYIW